MRLWIKEGSGRLDVVVEEPPHRVCHAGGRRVRDPHFESTKVVLSRAKIDRLHAMVSPRAPVVRRIPGQDLRHNRSNGMLLEVEQTSLDSLIR